jgi:chaperonin GroEL (HSP60 family)
MNLRRIIKEELLKEVGGYDDMSVMAQHAGTTMGALSSSANDLSNLLSGIANQVMDGADKNDISDSLREASKEIVFFIDIIKTAISEVMEDDVILQESFKRKIDVLSNFSDSMGNDEQFIERVKLLLMDLIPTLKEYSDQLMVTNKMFRGRLSNMGRSSFGTGFNSN